MTTHRLSIHKIAAEFDPTDIRSPFPCVMTVSKLAAAIFAHSTDHEEIEIEFDDPLPPGIVVIRTLGQFTKEEIIKFNNFRSPSQCFRFEERGKTYATLPLEMPT